MENTAHLTIAGASGGHSDGVLGATEIRVMAETLLRAISGMEIIAVVGRPDGGGEAIAISPVVREEAMSAYVAISRDVEAALASGSSLGEHSRTLEGVAWAVLCEEVRCGEEVVGFLVLARPGILWDERERGLGRSFAGMLSLVATQGAVERDLVVQSRLDELVSRVAEYLMSATSDTRSEALTWTTRTLAEFLGADVAFMRRHDHRAGLSLLEAEWPPREWNGPGPDPLGDVRFDSDPIFMETQHIKGPYFPGLADEDDFLARIEAGSGVEMVGGAAVPLLMDGATWGVLAFLHFNQYAWVAGEIRALQACASMLVQMQGRFSAESAVLYNAHHDDLTGLANRRALGVEIEARLRDGRECSVMLIDLDRFKVTNDYLGHTNGDKVLRTVADRLSTSVRAGDMVGRLGGDEFVFLMDNAGSSLETVASATRLLELIAQPIEVGGQFVTHTASIGITFSSSLPKDSSELLGWADVAMYSAKTSGRNRAVIFDEELRRVTDLRSATETLLAEGIDNGGLRLHFQPEIDLRDGSLLAAEALVRWEHPTRGLLNAGEFIKVAEESGLVVGIGRWVFAEACWQMGTWIAEFPQSTMMLRINMSPADFASEGIVAFVAECLRANGVPASRLCIEITEHAVFEARGESAAVLSTFREMGVEVAIDDFGTGYSSMTELRNVEVDFLKLDMSFVAGITTSRYDRAIVESIIRLAQVLDLGVVAEGIESAEVVQALVALGCWRGQGYLLSKPVGAAAMTCIIKNGGISASVFSVGAHA
jgi:diguanylate cyclase (GGDEF)-like protein